MRGRVDEHMTTQKTALSGDLGEWAEAFIIDRRAQSLSPKTVEFYTLTLKNFLQFCDTRAIAQLDQVTPEELRRYLLWLDTGHNEHGKAAYWRGVRAFIRWLWDETDQEARPPTDKVKSPREPKELLDPVSLPDVQALLSTCRGNEYHDLRDRAILLALIDTGLRANELLSLDQDDLSPGGAVQVRRGKGAKGRTVYFSQPTRKAIRAYVKLRDDNSPALFTTEKGVRLGYSGLRLMIQRRAGRAGIDPPEIHAFRRGYAIEALRAGANLLELQALLGHEDLKTLKRYAKLTGSDLQAAHGRSSPVDRLKRGGR